MPQPQITEEEIKQSEVLRYLGYRGQRADEAITEQIRECIHEMLRVIQPRCVYRRFPLTFLEEDTMEAGGLVLKSRNLSTNLRGCREVIYFASNTGKWCGPADDTLWQAEHYESGDFAGGRSSSNGGLL